MIAGILVGHGELPKAIHKTIQSFIGTQENFQIISNENCSAQELKIRLENAINDLSNQDTIIFVDLFGGSCANISKQVLKDTKATNISIICGVNLATLIKFFQYRDKTKFENLIHLLVETGKSEIKIERP